MSVFHQHQRSYSLFLILFTCVSLSQAATYYVDARGGSDTNDGLSQAQPWKTVAKVNAGHFKPGDKILFVRGGEWHESLEAGSDGAAGNPIVYGAYGTGANPKFWGSDVLANAMFAPISGRKNVYSYKFGKTANALFVNHAFFLDMTGGSLGADGQWLNAPDGTVQIRSATDPRNDGKTYSAAVRDDLVYSNGRNHLVFRDLDGDESAMNDKGDHSGYSFLMQNSTGIQMENCNAYRAGKHHIAVINSTDFRGVNLTAAYAQPGFGIGGASAFVSYGDVSGPHLENQTSVWENISVSHMEDLKHPGTQYQAIVTHGSNIGSVTVKHLVSNGAPIELSNNDNKKASIHLTDSSVSDAIFPSLLLYGNGITVDRITISGASATAELIGSNMTLQNCLIKGTNLGFNWFQAAVLSDGKDNTLRFCTIAPAGGDGAIALRNDNTSFRFYSNILKASGTALAQWTGKLSPASIAGADYNLYLKDPTFADFTNGKKNNYSLLDWQRMGLDQHSLTAPDPQFAKPGTDFTLLSSSPAVNAAHVPASLTKGVRTDLAGKPRPVGAAYDIGAYEYQAAARGK